MLKTDAAAYRFDAIHMRSMCSSRIRRRSGRLLLRALFWAVFVHAAAAALLAPLLPALGAPRGSLGFLWNSGARGGAATFGGPQCPRSRSLDGHVPGRRAPWWRAPTPHVAGFLAYPGAYLVACVSESLYIHICTAHTLAHTHFLNVFA